MVVIPMVVDDMYPDNFPPEIGLPIAAIALAWFTITTLKERRLEAAKARLEDMKGTK